MNVEKAIVLVLTDGENYGMGIKAAIEDMGETPYLSNIYTALYRMKKQGLVTSRIGEATNHGGNRRRYYKLIK